MKSLKSKLSKLAVFAFIGAFSFGLAISCVTNHKQNINKVFAADDISTTWEYNSNNKALSCTYASNYPNGFVWETNQVSVTGLGGGQYQLDYHVLGYPTNNAAAELTEFGTFSLIFISGYYDPTASNDAPYGSITASPLDISGLDSNTDYEIYLKVEPTGDMNEQDSGEGDDENAGTWTWNENTQKLSFQFNDTATAGYVSTTSQTMVYGHGNGTFDIEYDLWGTPGNATSASNDLLATKMIRIFDGYYDEDQSTVTGIASEISELASYGQITIKVDVDTSGTMNSDGWRVNDGVLYFYVLADVNPASIDSITWNHSSGNGTGEAILSVTISTNGGSFQQVYQINTPTFNPELEGTSGTTLGNTTVEGISEWSDRPVLIDISNKSYSLGESTQAEITSLELLENPPTYYSVGDVIDFSNIILVANYSDGSIKEVYSNEYVAYFSPEGECDPYQPLVSGDYMLYFSYEGATTESGVPIYVNEREPETQAEITSLVLLEDPPSYYFVGDVIDFTNIILVANYSDGSTKEVYSNEYVAYLRPEGECDPYEPLVSGDYTLYFSYDGVTTESGVPIYVNEREPETYEFEIIFVANDGTSETRTNSFTHSESSYTYDLPSIEQIGFTREGYSFVGWSYYSDGEVLKEAPVIESGRTTEFYAIWEEVSSGYTYSVIFNGNGATSGAMETDTFTSSEYSYDYIFPECRFEREGYEFIGWSFTEEGLIKFKPGETRNITNGETTFFAIWAEQFTITFEANGGSGYMEPITVTSGERHTVPGCDFTREGYSFVCWAVNSPTSSMTVNPDDSVSVTQNYVLYAVWEQDGPVQHEGMWYDEQSNRLRFYNTDLGGEQEVELEVIVLDFGSNTSLTHADLSAIIYYEDSIWETRSYDMRTFTISEDSGRQFISGQLDLQDGEGERAVKLYVETLYNNVMTPGLNYVDGYNQIYYVNASMEPSVVEPELVEFDELNSICYITAYARDLSGEEDFLTFEFQLTDAVVISDDAQEVKIVEGFWAEGGRRISYRVFDISYKSVEVPIQEETIEEINNGMDGVNLSDDQKQQINDKINENADKIEDKTGQIMSQALEGTVDLIHSDPDIAEKQKEVIVVVLETAIEVDTNKTSDIGDAKRVDNALPANSDLNVENEIREFYERQMAELLGSGAPTRAKTRAASSGYQININVGEKTGQEAIGHLDNEITLYGKMMDFIDNSVSHMSEAALKIRQCSGESVKISVKNYVTTVKVSSFREFDKEAADAEFLENVYKAIMLHMQEQVINTLESEHKDSGNKEKEEVYQNELAAVKDYETFEIMVTEVLRQKYVALTGDETYTQENLENFFNDVYWPIFRVWALDEDIPQELKDKGINITLEQLTTTTIEQSTSRARAFTIHSDLQNNEIIFLAAFGGGVVLTISLAAIIPTIINKRRRGLVK